MFLNFFVNNLLYKYKYNFWRNMKKITALIIAFSMFGSLYADDHKK